jgi:putative transposase
MKYDYKLFRRRNLPHLQPPDVPIFITYNLKFDLPEEIKEIIKQKRTIFKKNTNPSKSEIIGFEKRIFELFDDFLVTYKHSPQWLAVTKIGDIIVESLHFLNNKYYKLLAFCIMSNHVHILVKPLMDENSQPFSLPKIMHDHKRFTARESNKILQRKGHFWQDENYDHYIRNDEEFYNVVWYIINNPVKANLVKSWKEWKYTWVEDEVKRNL